MAEGIAAQDAPGAALGAMMQPGGGAPAAGPGAGQEAMQQKLQQIAGQVRQINALAQQVGGANPEIAAEMEQIGEILKVAIVKMAQQAPAQTPSSLAVPGQST